MRKGNGNGGGNRRDSFAGNPPYSRLLPVSSLQGIRFIGIVRNKRKVIGSENCNF